MPKIKHNKTPKEKRRQRARSKLFGSSAKPRLSVFRSNAHIALQVIDDEAGKTLAASSDLGKKFKATGTKIEKAIKIAQDLFKKLKTKKITKLIFDRAHYKYHGRVKAVAETLRKEGIQI